VALLSAGEEAGRLDQTFKLLAHYYASRAKIIYEAIASLAITTVTVHVFLLVFPIGLLQQFALGIMHGQYRDCVPFLVEKAVVFGGLYGLAWFLMFACQGNRRPGWRSVMERFFGMVPWLGASVKCLSVARLAMALEALLGAGVPMIRAWELAAASSGSQKLRSDITRWAPELEVGTTPAEMVVQIRYFPEMFTHLYQTGEMSGKLDETLEHLHTYFQDEGFRQLRIFCRVLNFVIYFGVAAFIAVFIIRFWLNYFNQALGAF
jgi:type II secretory pathway component PulF